MRIPSRLAQHLAALRALLVLTVVLGLAYPLLLTGIGRLPGLDDRAGSRLIGQAFTGADGMPVPRYFQSRPSAAGYDPTATAASNLGPESIVDAPEKPSLLTQVCTRSAEVAAAMPGECRTLDAMHIASARCWAST